MKYFIWGTQELSRVMCYYLNNDFYRVMYGGLCLAEMNKFNSLDDWLGLVVDREYLKNPKWTSLGINIFDVESLRYAGAICKGSGIFLPIGYKDNNKLREKKYFDSLSLGLKPLTFIHDSAYIAKDALIGDASIILEQTRVQTGAKVGKGCILWNPHIGHSAKIGDFCFISSNSVISGGVHVEKNSFIGINCSIKENVTISEGTVLGASSVITKDTVPYGVYLAGANNYYKDSRE